jgi:tetratricopeptide (TPR) repeat protein
MELEMVHRVAQSFRSNWYHWIATAQNWVKAVAMACACTASAGAWAQPIAAPRYEPKEVVPQQLSKWTIFDPDPVRSLPSPEQRDADPLQFGYFLMDLSDRAEAAIAAGNHKKAIRYFDTLAKAVPNRAISYAKLCMCYAAIGEWSNAEAQCAIAVEKEGVRVEDFSSYAQILLAKKSDFGSGDVQKLTAVIQHIRQELPKGTLADEIDCQLGLKLDDAKRLDGCTKRLAAAAPNDPKTLTYRWSYALLRGDTGEARRIIEHARRTSAIPQKALEKMEESTRRSRFTKRGLLRSSWLLAASVVLLGVGCLGYLIAIRRRQPAAG